MQYVLKADSIFYYNVVSFIEWHVYNHSSDM